MSFPATIDNLLNHKVKDDCNIFSVKKFDVSHTKREDILEKLVFMSTFEEISKWVEKTSHNQRYIANPFSASDTDRLDCLFAIQEPLVLALKNVEKRRKNGRDSRLIEASEKRDYSLIADILASTATTYWRDHGFFKNGKNLKLASFLKNNEKNLKKIESQKAQIEHIGASVSFEKSRKKGAFQEVLDFVETEEILKTFDDMVA